MILLAILANCVVLALDDRLPNGDRTPLSIRLVSRRNVLSVAKRSCIVIRVTLFMAAVRNRAGHYIFAL